MSSLPECYLIPQHHEAPPHAPPLKAHPQTHFPWACAGYLSAICHDLDHKGLNNDFLIKTSNPLAIQYNDLSPLENHHLAQSFRLLNRDDCGLFRHLPKDRQVSSTSCGSRDACAVCAPLGLKPL